MKCCSHVVWLINLLPHWTAASVPASGLREHAGDNPFAGLGCAKVTQPDSDWVWKTMVNHQPVNLHSCDGDIRGDGVSMCLNSTGQPDYTSIFVDMTSVEDRTGCFAWYSHECSFDLRRVSKLEFDIEMKGCGDVWTGPFWITPEAWYGPGGLSGEIDLLEACPVGNLRNNFAGCDGVDPNQCKEYKVSSLTAASTGPKHIVMTLDNSSHEHLGGSLRTQVCDLKGENCVNGGFFVDFLSTVHSTKMRPAGMQYYMVSDVWNGLSGDGGWTGCQARNTPGTQCQFAVMNIQVHGNDGVKVFNSGKCTALNAHAPYPPPPPPPSPPSPPPPPAPSPGPGPAQGPGPGLVIGIVAIILVVVIGSGAAWFIMSKRSAQARLLNEQAIQENELNVSRGPGSLER